MPDAVGIERFVAHQFTARHLVAHNEASIAGAPHYERRDAWLYLRPYANLDIIR